MPVRTPRHRIAEKTSAKSSELDKMLAHAETMYKGVNAQTLKELIYPIVAGYKGNDATELERLINKAIWDAGYERVFPDSVDKKGRSAAIFTGSIGNLGTQTGMFGNFGRNMLKLRNMGALDEYFNIKENPNTEPSEEEPAEEEPIRIIPVQPTPNPSQPFPVFPPVEEPSYPGPNYPEPYPVQPYPEEPVYPEPVYPEPVYPESAYGTYRGHDLSRKQGKRVALGKRVSLGPTTRRVILPRIEGYGYQNTPKGRLGHVEFQYEGEYPTFDAYGDWVDSGRTAIMQPTWVLSHRLGGKFIRYFR